MAKKEHWQDTFDKFLKVFIINRRPLITNGDVEKFTEEDTNNCLKILQEVETMNPPKDKNDKSLFSKLKTLKGEEESYLKSFSLLWHCYWIMYLMGETAKGFMKELKPDGLQLNEKYDGINLFVNEIASTNQAYNSKGIRPFKCLLILIQKLWKDIGEETTEVENIKDNIIKSIWTNKDSVYKDSVYKDSYDYRIKNILLYLCKHDVYIPIVSQHHKEAISKNLGFLIDHKNGDDVEKKYRLIEQEVVQSYENESKERDSNLMHSLYDKCIRPFWDTPKVNLSTDTDGDLEMKTLLLFKKAIVLYGPPGTSKSYTARELAQSVICEKLVEILRDTIDTNDKKKLFKNFLTNENELFGNNRKDVNNNGNQREPIMAHIHQLQMHPNYTYDDFIVGKTIKDNSVAIQKGYLLNLIDEINDDRIKKNIFAELPHIVILDKINRVDISRVFGELFTAMESDYRKYGLELPASIISEYKDGKEQKTAPLSLKVPDDLYFIGTMNMIDFSLEQIDFALRRRFAWIENTFDKDRLKDIIKDKNKNLGFDIEKYIQLCDDVNKEIGKTMGEEYWIGHTFFAEIVDIIKIVDYDSSEKQDAKNEEENKFSKARRFLWAISIKPMIEAYCGSMVKEAKEEFVDKCKAKFIPEDTKNKKSSNAEK